MLPLVLQHLLLYRVRHLPLSVISPATMHAHPEAHTAAICRWIDWNRKQESSTANVEIAWKTLVWGFIYRYVLCCGCCPHPASSVLTLPADCDRALLYGVWAWLQFFSGACLETQACSYWWAECSRPLSTRRVRCAVGRLQELLLWHSYVDPLPARACDYPQGASSDTLD